MNNQYPEINLKWLLYRILRAWRTIAVWAILIAILVGVGKLGINLSKLSDPEYIEEAKIQYEREHAGWVSTGENLEISMENLSYEQQKQQDYNEKSILMKIDPLREQIASIEFYLSYEYQIMPDMTYQNIDMSNRILKAYATYMTNGELYQYILDNLSYDLELRYLKEILSLSIDYSNNMISASLRHKDNVSCQEILRLVESGLFSRQTAISEAISAHSLISTNKSSYEQVNFSLEQTQKDNLQAISKIDMRIQELNEEYLEWKKEPEPELETSNRWAITDAIKAFLIAGFTGGVVIAIIIAFGCILSGRLKNPNDMKTRFGLRIIAQLPCKYVKKPLAFLSRHFAALGGIRTTPDDYQRLAKMAGTSIKSDLATQEFDQKAIAFTGTLPEQELQQIIDACELKNSFSVLCAPDILTNAASIEAITSADCVVLVEKQECSAIADIEKELEALKAWNKPVLGAIITNTDAIM